MSKLRYATALMAFMLLIAASEGSEARSRCRPSEEAGWLLSIEASTGGRPAAEPFIRSARGRLSVAEGDRLCALEQLVNPPDSRRTIWYRFAGGEKKFLRAGNQVLIPEPKWWAGLKDLANRLLSDSGGDTPLARTPATRGGGCLYNPAGMPTSALVVREWGPLRVAWPCLAGEDGPWVASLASRSEKIGEVELTLNFIEADLSRCRDQCELRIRDAEGRRPPRIIRITTASAHAAGLPRSIAKIAPGPARTALVGAWLLRPSGDRQWALQGTSLLHAAGCDLPAAAAMAERFYGYPAPDEPCLDAE